MQEQKTRFDWENKAYKDTGWKKDTNGGHFK